jgi:hypothetical protein
MPVPEFFQVPDCAFTVSRYLAHSAFIRFKIYLFKTAILCAEVDRYRLVAIIGRRLKKKGPTRYQT